MKCTGLVMMLLLLQLHAVAQTADTAIAGTISWLREFYTLNPQEKCFTTTDKQFYQPGETVWFSSLLTLYDRSSTLSGIVYVDLGDASGKLWAKTMWKVTNGQANGSLYLNDTMPTGIYRLRTYSLWMLNEPVAVHEHFIFVLGKKDQSKSFITQYAPAALQLFAEGGNLVPGFANRIAFTLYRNDGLPVGQIYSTSVTDGSGKPIPHEVQYKNGLGWLEFTPAAATYTVQVFENKSQFHTATITANNNNISVKAGNLSASKVNLEVLATETAIGTYPNVWILVQQNGQTVYVNRFNLQEGQLGTLLNKKQLQPGLAQVLLLNEQMQPLSQRWLWIQKPSSTQISIGAIQLNTAPKGVNSFELRVAGVDAPQLNISITPADLPAPSFLPTNNWLQYAAIQSNQQRKTYFSEMLQPGDSLFTPWLDAALLVAQPQRFNWQLLQQRRQPALQYFYETGISIRGFVQQANSGTDTGRVELITKGEDSTTILSNALVDQRGAFAVNDLDFRKQATVFIQAYTKERKKKPISFQLQPAYLDTLQQQSTSFGLVPQLLAEKTVSPAQQQFVQQYSQPGIGKELNEIVIKGKRTSKADSLSNLYATDLFRNSDYTFVPEGNFSYASVWQMLQEQIPGLYVSSATATEPMVSFNRYTLTNDRISNGDGSANSTTAVPVAFFLNEIPIELGEVTTINPADVIMIKANRMPNVLIGSFAMAAGAEGSILIYTKKQAASASGFAANSVRGYSVDIPFIQPDYSKPAAQAWEDRRTTLLWIPKIVTDSTGKAVIKFYNNSYSKRFKVVIQGLDSNGHPYYLERILE